MAAADQFNRENAMRLISYDDLRPVKGIRYSRVQLWRLERDGRFPKRVSVGPARHAWVEAEIDRYIEERIRARDEAAA
jgi:prophage regulatory protein